MTGAGDIWLVDDDGTRHYWRDEADGGFTITTSTDVSAALEANKAAALAGGPRSKEMRRVASIPNALILKWRDEGFDIYDRNNHAELLRRLDSSDFRFLRTDESRLGRGAGRVV